MFMHGIDLVAFIISFVSWVVLVTDWIYYALFQGYLHDGGVLNLSRLQRYLSAVSKVWKSPIMNLFYLILFGAICG